MRMDLPTWHADAADPYVMFFRAPHKLNGTKTDNDNHVNFDLSTEALQIG